MGSRQQEFIAGLPGVCSYSPLCLLILLFSTLPPNWWWVRCRRTAIKALLGKYKKCTRLTLRGRVIIRCGPSKTSDEKKRRIGAGASKGRRLAKELPESLSP
ncbi:MAG: hypothetical protein ACXAEI_17105 [Candidatus Hodarchaeales archaeon]